MLVEMGLPGLNGRVVSSLEVYEDLARERPYFDRGMVCALIRYAQDSTREQDFALVVETARMRRKSALAGACLLLTALLAAVQPDAFGVLLQRFVGAFSEARQFARKVAGASIEVEPGDATILRGEELRLVARQKGFHSDEVLLYIRKEGDDAETVETLAADSSGVAEKLLTNTRVGCSYHFAAEKIRSSRHTIKVTDRPRIVNMRIEYEFPRYVRRAPVAVGRSDGRIEGLYGSLVTLTLEASKPLGAVGMTVSYEAEPVEVSLGGKFARAMIKLGGVEGAGRSWLKSDELIISEHYQIRLTCEDGYTNDDSERLYPIIIRKDRPPEIQFVRLLNRSPEHEVHVLDSDVGSIGFYVDARDDYGLQQIDFHYRIEDLMTNEMRREDMKRRTFRMPQSEFSAGLLLRLSDLEPGVGDRVVFRAEAADAYDLEPEKGPHTCRTPEYRIAVVTKEELFEEVLYSDDWSTTWYDPLKVAALSRRAAPPRMSPTNEPLAKVAELLLQKSPHSDRVSIENQRMVQDYFNSINVER